MKRRGPVQWKPGMTPGAATSPPAITVSRPHRHENDIPAEQIATYEAALVPGYPFVTAVALEQEKLAPNVVKPPVPALQKFHNSWRHPELAPFVPEGSLAMYAGQVRTEEDGKQGKLRVIRHKFIVADGQYIIPDLNWVRPL